MKRKRLILALIIVAAFAVFGVTAFQHALTPYVTFVEAAAKGGTAQVSGTVARSQVSGDETRRPERR